MASSAKRLAGTAEFYVILTVVGLCLLIVIKNPVFFSLQNWFDLARSTVEMGILSLGFLLVLASGGLDVSIGPIAVFSMVTAARIANSLPTDVGVWLGFLIGAVLGLLLGMCNALLISLFRLPPLVVTLGTASIFKGATLIFISYKIITELPKSWLDFGKATIITTAGQGDQSVGLAVSVLILIAVAIVVWLLLRQTVIGRGIYALGGNPVAARRSGFPIVGTHLLAYGLCGALAGIAGIIHATATRMASPFDYMGIEMSVIAAVVLGGARITGGHGSVLGTLFGVLLVTIMNNSLILLGVSSYWQRVVVGLLVLVGSGIAAYRANRPTTPNLLDT